MPHNPPPTWVRLTSLVMSTAGLAVSAYLTFEHYTAAETLVCPETGAVNCVKVTTSSYAALLGVPVAPLGLLFFVALTALCLPLPWCWGNKWVSRTRLVGSAGGVGFVCYLVWAELFRLDAICLWCTAVHVITLAMFAVLALSAALYPAAVSRKV